MQASATPRTVPAITISTDNSTVTQTPLRIAGGEIILEDVALHVEQGELLMVRGTNGAGKTTLLKILAGLLPAETLAMQWQGKALTPRSQEYLSALGYLGHLLAIKEDLTCAENLTFWAGLTGVAIDPRKTLAAVGLAGYTRSMARELSAGQHKRLALARLTLTHRPLWLLDEPYSNLDANGIALVDRILGAHLAAGGAAIATSHGTFIPQLDNWREISL